METSVSVPLGPSALLKHANSYSPRRLDNREPRNRHTSQDHVVTVLDGDTIRAKPESNLNFTTRSREENLRRAGKLTPLFASAGHIVIATSVSPHRHGH